MRVPLSWLRDYVDVELTPEQLAERLTLLGMEIKGLERWGAEWRNVMTGELLEVARHPRADRLSITRVRVGDEVLDIVCGATNIAAGQRVPVALPGAVLPGNRAIERTEKMGVVSNGMLCSGDELHLTGDAEGILILPDDTPLGVPLADLYGDVILDVDVKPNRGDVLSLMGLAREVAAITGAPVRPPEIRLVERMEPATADLLAVAVVDASLCTRFVGRWVSGVTVGPSPDRIQMRLLAAGLRPVSNVVDATNYTMLELGKPTHAFDGASVARDAAGRAAIIVRSAVAGERLETLDHVEREFGPDALLIADANGPLSIAGVMGGARSEVSASTRDVIIESAVFDPVSIRRTAFRHALRSEASLRFEKGQEARLARLGADRVAELVTAWAGGHAAAGRVDTAPDEPTGRRVPFRPGRVNRLLGTAFTAAEQIDLLGRVGIDVEAASASAPADPGESLVARIPTWRRELEVEADVAEEIARVGGYDSIPTKTPDTQMPRFRADPLERRDAIRRALVGAGLTEVVTPALVPEWHLRRLAWPVAAAAGIPGEETVAGNPIRVRNPLSERHAVLRGGLVGSLLDVLVANERHGRDDVAVFEIGKGYAADPNGSPAEWWRLAFLLAGAAVPASWSIAGRPWDIEDAKALVALVAATLGAAAPVFAPHPDGAPLHPGRSAHATSTGSVAGLVGEIHPETAQAWDLRAGRVVAGELAIAGLGAGQLPVARIVPVSRHGGVERDLAVVVAEGVEAGAVATTLRVTGGSLVRGMTLFDVYRGVPLDPSEKSLAWRLAIRADDRSLDDGEVDELLGRLVAAVVAAHDGRLRA
ncbi:MAG: phenylalanine--tRNA ligase subunit beta [Chloroflexota bacterium]